MYLGHWTFPKGHMKPDESEQQTAIREIKEETNLNITILEGFRQIISYIPEPDIEKEVVYFLGQPINDTIIRQEEEIKSIVWLEFKEAMRRLTYDSDRNTLEKAQYYFKLA